MQTFFEWLDTADGTTLALAIARAGAAGVCHDDLCRLLRVSSETLEGMLAAMATTGQVVIVKRNGERVYRAAWQRRCCRPIGSDAQHRKDFAAMTSPHALLND